MKESASAWIEYEKPQRRWPLALFIIADILLLAGCGVAFWFANGPKYEHTVSLAQTWVFSDAKRYESVLLPIEEDSAQLEQFIEAGILMEAGAYEESQRILQALGSYLNAEELYRECSFRYAQRLFDLTHYEEARSLLLQLGEYGEARLWADEAAYRIGIEYYTKLAEATETPEILSLSELAIAQFSDVVDHENAAIMLDRTSAYLYALGVETFESASSLYNAVTSPAEAAAAGEEDAPTGVLEEDPDGSGAPEEDEEAEDTGDAPPAEEGASEPAAPDATAESILPMFADASRFFALIPAYQDSAQYLEVIDLLNLPANEAAEILREDLFAFAPARKFLFGKYIAEFFYGRWSGGGYGIAFTDTYHFYLLNPESAEGGYGTGGISTNTTTGWKTAYSFNIIDQDTIQVIGAQTYTLSRVPPEETPAQTDTGGSSANA